jgi:hypothetical protein
MRLEMSGIGEHHRKRTGLFREIEIAELVGVWTIEDAAIGGNIRQG